ncbi:hypothetical protein EV702DRAFT_98012 [Suillus placidus]|uniref:Secreted protein n=1 Tax=Suillus placidus TaxID=48579 RepID=A0A9P7D527_9AGAM|nr:hypothetical protein EV702DRAFT_98012 [Suillus placidus]
MQRSVRIFGVSLLQFIQVYLSEVTCICGRIRVARVHSVGILGNRSWPLSLDYGVLEMTKPPTLRVSSVINTRRARCAIRLADQLISNKRSKILKVSCLFQIKICSEANTSIDSTTNYY